MVFPPKGWAIGGIGGHIPVHVDLSREAKKLHSLVSIQGPLGYEPNTLPLRQSAWVMSSLRTKTSLIQQHLDEIKIYKVCTMEAESNPIRSCARASISFSQLLQPFSSRTNHDGLSPSGALRPAGISCAGDSFGFHRPYAVVLSFSQ